jgi:hypothetical protein
VNKCAFGVNHVAIVVVVGRYRSTACGFPYHTLLNRCLFRHGSTSPVFGNGFLTHSNIVGRLWGVVCGVDGIKSKHAKKRKCPFDGQCLSFRRTGNAGKSDYGYLRDLPRALVWGRRPSVDPSFGKSQRRNTALSKGMLINLKHLIKAILLF